MALEPSRPFYERQPGDLCVHLDVYDAVSIRPDKVGSRQYFLVNVSERFAALLQKSELHKLKAFFDKRNTLIDTTIEYFNDSCLCVLCPSNAGALVRLRKDYDTGRLERFFLECFVTPVAVKKLELTALKLKIRMWKDEFEMAEREWKEGVMPVKYDMADNEKSVRMLRMVRQFQLQFVQDEESGAAQRLRSAESKFESGFASLVTYLKLLRNNSMTPVRSVKEVVDRYEEAKDSIYSPDAKLLDHFLHTVQDCSAVVRAIESAIVHPLGQIRVGGETDEQTKKRKEIFQLIRSAKEALRPETPLKLKHEATVAKVTESERLVLANFLSLLPCAVRMVLDLDEAIDDYFNAGSVIFRKADLLA